MLYLGSTVCFTAIDELSFSSPVRSVTTCLLQMQGLRHMMLE